MSTSVASQNHRAQTNDTEPERSDKMPAGIPFIVANEFAERFCFYGINAVLSVYMTKFLRFGEADATTWHSLFKSGAYFSPIIGAIVSDVFWGKYRTIVVFSVAYAAGCLILALVPGTFGLTLGLFLVALGTGGIKPCVSANVGDQFTSKNAHLIERAFSYFYLAINAGSSVSIFFCPILLNRYGPLPAFGIPAVMMLIATFIFWRGRHRFAVVPPAGKAWLDEVLSKKGLATVSRLALVYFFVAFFWALWDQSNGQTWTLQAQSSLMDKDLGFGVTLLPAQLQVVNGFFILALVPIFSFVVYPLLGRLFTVTPLRKIGMGLFVTGFSFVIVAGIESRISSGQKVSAWWQILAYVFVTAGEVLVSITALEYAYKQAPLRMKSFIVAFYLLSVSLGNGITAAVNHFMVRPLFVSAVTAGPQTWVTLGDAGRELVVGQKIDFAGETKLTQVEGQGTRPLSGTYLVGDVRAAEGAVRIVDSVERRDVVSSGIYSAATSQASIYRLVGSEYFYFFVWLVCSVGVVFAVVAARLKDETYVRDDRQPAVAN